MFSRGRLRLEERPELLHDRGAPDPVQGQLGAVDEQVQQHAGEDVEQAAGIAGRRRRKKVKCGTSRSPLNKHPPDRTFTLSHIGHISSTIHLCINVCNFVFFWPLT